MIEPIETFSGTEQVISDKPGSYDNLRDDPSSLPYRTASLTQWPKRAKAKPKQGPVSLTDLFRERVLESANLAWYVDYYTQDPWRYHITYLAKTPLIRWTHENLDERDPAVDQSWTPAEIAELFEGCPHRNYEHVVKFHSAGTAHELRIAAFNVTLDGEDRWAEYITLGVRGAMGALVESFDHLDGIEVFLDEKGLPSFVASKSCGWCEIEDKENAAEAEE